MKNGVVSFRRESILKYSFGLLSYSYIPRDGLHLSTVSFSCNNGFSLVGHSVATCMANSEWNVPLPRCKVILCKFIQLNILNIGLPKTDLVSDQMKTFENAFLSSLATYSLNAQPSQNYLGCNDQANILNAQSDVKLDLLFAFNIREKSPLEDVYKTFLNNTIMNFPIDANKTHVAVLVVSSETILKFTGTAGEANVLNGNPSSVSGNWEVLVENINMMFEAGLQGERRAAKRMAVIVNDRLLSATNEKRLMAATKRNKELNVKSLVLSKEDVPLCIRRMAAEIIPLNTIDEFRTFVIYTSPSI